MSQPVWNEWEDQEDDPEETRVIFSALDSYAQYSKVAHFNVTHLRRQSFYALPNQHWKMLSAAPFSYLETLDKADAAIDSNADLSRAILNCGLESFTRLVPRQEGEAPSMPHQWAGIAKHSDIDKARSTLRQFYRDWTEDGKRERDLCYAPVFRALSEQQARQPDESLDILVPGAGLGRLVLELCLRGFNVEGNEISYHQLLASAYILNNCNSAGQHTLHPWVHTFSNHVTRENHLRGYPVPDIHPATLLAGTENKGTMNMCAADFLCLYGDEEQHETRDAVASVFFLDTAPNLIRYLEVIYKVLRPGGILVNVGPLLWHFENNPPGSNGGDDDGDGVHDLRNSSGIADPGSFELTNDEVMALVERIGFKVEWMETNLETPYIQDRDSMLLNTYKGTAWAARKPSVGAA
ncbi:hypothetical protein LIA77_05754 [Sarocladium implicatum]|nr:hypothetical protein LIA77_05754 [Sarocladium implicatum]